MDEAVPRDELVVPVGRELAEPAAEHEDARGLRAAHVLEGLNVPAEPGHA